MALTLLFCVALGVAAARSDRASEAGLRAAGVYVSTEAEELATAAAANRYGDLGGADSRVDIPSTPGIAT